MDDVRAVMDAAGSDSATLLGHSEGGSMSIVFAATHPNRTNGLVLVGCYATRTRSPDYPWAPDPADREAEVATIERTWGDPDHLPPWVAPSRMSDPAFVEWMARYMRLSASPHAAAALLRMNTQIDTRHVLSAISVPTLCLYRTGDQDVNIEEGRWIADQIEGAKFVEIDGSDHLLNGQGSDAVQAARSPLLRRSVRHSRRSVSKCVPACTPARSSSWSRRSLARSAHRRSDRLARRARRGVGVTHRQGSRVFPMNGRSTPWRDSAR